MEKEETSHIIFGNGDFKGHRFHVREEEVGGVIVIDASRLLFLNETGFDYAVAAIQAADPQEVVAKMRIKYDIDEASVLKDYQALRDKILGFVETPDVDPVETFGFDEMAPFGHTPKAPYRVDLALTYRCNNNCSHCYVDKDRRTWDSSQELSTEQWKKILDRLARVGVPHVSFTGGEPTLRNDLVELVQHAQDIGIITGLITNGRLLTKELTDKLVNAGIDYVQITLESQIPEVHDQMVGVSGAWNETVQGLKNFIPTDIYTITNSTLTQLNRPTITGLPRFLADLGQTVFAMNGLIYSGSGRTVAPKFAIPENELGNIVTDLLMEASEANIRMIWYTPTQYCNFNPEEYGLGQKRCSAAFSSLAIEPNGAVIPCQSYFKPLGNILSTPWSEIWNHPLAKQLREYALAPEKCKNCELIKRCCGGCPLYADYGTLQCAH